MVSHCQWGYNMRVWYVDWNEFSGINGEPTVTVRSPKSRRCLACKSRIQEKKVFQIKRKEKRLPCKCKDLHCPHCTCKLKTKSFYFCSLMHLISYVEIEMGMSDYLKKLQVRGVYFERKRKKILRK